MKKKNFSFLSVFAAQIGKLPFFRLKSIKGRLSVGLVIPIIFLSIYGVVSYQASKDTIIDNYFNRASDTINAINKYMSLGLDMAELSSMEIVLDINFRKYFEMNYDDAIASTKSYDDIQDRINLNSRSNYFVSNIHIIGANGVGISTVTGINSHLYDQVVNSSIGKAFKEKKAQYMWVGDHAELDKILFNNKEYSTKSYACSIIRKFNDGRGFIIFDISTDRIRDMFADYYMGDGSIMGYITEDGRETLSDPELSNVFIDTVYYEKALESEDISGFSEVKYKGKDYLFIYSKFEGMKGMICSLVPMSTLLSEVKNIRMLSVLFVTIACIIAIIIVYMISKGISDTIVSINNTISQAAMGDLTVQINTKRNDEFYTLVKCLSDMIDKIRTLICEVYSFSGTVSNSARHLSSTSNELLEATKGISVTIDDISKGIINQAEDSQNCAQQMAGLSEQINQLYDNTNENEKIVDYTMAVANDGINIIEELNEKSKATSEITQDVIKKIEEYEIQSKKIESFVNIINEIAEQTNLLSLNASIEAARAGDAGRGFAVVAEEIRKLADQTVDAARQIQNTVKEITLQNKETVKTARKAKDIVSSQIESLNKTIDVFNKISNQVNHLAENFKGIILRLKTIETVKDATLNSIQNISAVTEQTAASAEEMNATAQIQSEAVEQLQKSASKLKNDVSKLEETIRKFKV